MKPPFRRNSDAEEAAIRLGIAADPENPEWTDEDFASAQLAADSVPEVVAAFPRPRGRPPGQNKELVSLRLDKDVVDSLRVSGRGWQSRANALLRKAVLG